MTANAAAHAVVVLLMVNELKVVGQIGNFEYADCLVMLVEFNPSNNSHRCSPARAGGKRVYVTNVTETIACRSGPKCRGEELCRLVDSRASYPPLVCCRELKGASVVGNARARMRKGRNKFAIGRQERQMPMLTVLARLQFRPAADVCSGERNHVDGLSQTKNASLTG